MTGVLPLFALALARPADESPAARPAARDVDAELARRAANGDRGAFDDLYRRHVDAVYRLLTRLVGPDPEREDLVQRAFLEVFRALPRFRGDAAFSTWLYRVVANVAYEHLRSRRRRPTTPVAPEDLDLLVAPGLTPEATARQKEQITRALGLLAALKPKKRIAFVLRIVEGLSLDEIGAIVGARAAAVGQRVKHAQRELDAMLARADKRKGSHAPV